MGEANEPGNDISNLSTWHKLAIVLALLGGASNGFVGIINPQDTTDRYHAHTAKADLAERDERITQLERQQNAHARHSATYTQIIEQLREKIKELKEEVHSHQRGGMHRE